MTLKERRRANGLTGYRYSRQKDTDPGVGGGLSHRSRSLGGQGPVNDGCFPL